MPAAGRPPPSVPGSAWPRPCCLGDGAGGHTRPVGREAYGRLGRWRFSAGSPTGS